MTASFRPRAAGRIALLTVALAACGDSGGPRGPGSLEARVESPNGAEGAAVIQLMGAGVEGVRAAGARVHSAQVDSVTTRLVLIRDTPGELRFQVDVRDIGAPLPTAVILQVADGNNALRGSLSGYRVDLHH